MVKSPTLVGEQANLSKVTHGKTIELNEVIYSVDPNIIYRRIGDETVLINLKTEKIFTLNNTGSKFWEYITQGLSLDQIRFHLMDEFDVDATQMDHECGQMIEALTAEKFIHPKE